MKKFIDRMGSSGEKIKADYHLFIDIQMGKYLSSKNKSEFSSEEEANMVMGKIVKAYNQKIASDHLRLDNLNEASKASWFNSVEINFDTPVDSFQPVKGSSDIKKATKEFISFYNKLFPFLPEGAIIYLLNTGPALEAYGYPLERFKKIIDGEEPTEIEEDLLLWAYDIAFGVAQAYLEKDKVKKANFLSVSYAIANEELDEKTALNVVSQIYAAYEESFSMFERKEQKPKTKKKKRKNR